MPIRHILSAIDLAPHSDAAFHEALRLARRHKARLTLLHAVPTRERFNDRSNVRRGRLSALSAAARECGVRLRVSVQQGDTAGVILLHARARAVDLIVLGGGGRPMPRFGRDSTAETVARQAPCPTLIVPSDAEPPDARSGAVLCAVNLAEGSTEAIDQALRAAHLLVTGPPKVIVLHVFASRRTSARPRYRSQADHEHRQYLYLAAWRRLQALIPTRARMAGTTRARVIAGDTGTQIGAVAREIDASLVVIASTRKGTWSRRLFGSSTTTIIHTAQCPVLIVAPAALEEDPARPLARAA